jgi:hypothetical protein
MVGVKKAQSRPPAPWAGRRLSLSVSEKKNSGRGTARVAPRPEKFFVSLRIFRPAPSAYAKASADELHSPAKPWRSRAPRGAWWCLFERIPDRVKHAFRIFEHVDVPKSQNAITPLDQPFRSNFVVRRLFRLSVLTSIQFDDELRGKAKEIGKVRPDRMLSPEPHACEPLVADKIPKPALGFGLTCAKMFGDAMRQREMLP